MLSLTPLKTLLRARALAALVLVLATGCSGHHQTAAIMPTEHMSLKGTVHGGQQPVVNSSIQLFAVGSGGDGTASTSLISATILTQADGSFDITGDYTCPASNPEVYLVAQGGNPGLPGNVNNAAILMLAGLGPCNTLSAQTFIAINEITTVATVIPLAPYTTAYNQIASGTADQAALSNAFVLISEIVNTATGTSPGAVAPPAGYAVPTAEINLLADAVATCVNSDGSTAAGSPCGLLFQYTTPAGQSAAPTDTAGALTNIGQNPGINLSQIFNLVPASAPFQPVPPNPPTDWDVDPNPMITLSAPAGLVAVGGSVTGSISLAAAAPSAGLTVTLVSSDTTAVTLPAATVTIAAGQTTGTFNYSGVASKTATITASGPDYAPGTLSVTPTTQVLTIGSPQTFGPNQSFALAVGTTQSTTVDTAVTLTASVEGIVNLTTYNNTVTIPAGSTSPTSLPQLLTGNIGKVTITATASGYASATTTVTVVDAASLPNNVSLAIGTTSTTLTLQYPAPQSGLSFNLTSSAPAVATVPATVNVNGGATTVSIPITGVAAGTAILTASATGISAVTSNLTVTGNITSADQISGVHMLTYGSFSVAQLASATTFTVTSNNPNIVTIGADAAHVGTASASFTYSSPGTAGFTIQGQAVGSTTITISAPGMNSAIANVTVDPAGFGFSSGSGTTTTFSGALQIQTYVSILDPQTLYPIGNATLSPGYQSTTVTVVSSNTAVGTVTNPTFTTAGYAYSSLNPVGPGSTTLSIVQPAGFSASSYQPTITTTVIMPKFGADSVNTGVHAEQLKGFSLPINPPSPVTSTVTVADPTIALLTSDPTVVGSTSVSYPNMTYSGTNLAANNRNFYIQGQKLGTTSLTISAPGFQSVTWPISVTTAGFSYLISANVQAYGQQATGSLTLIVQDQYQYSFAVLLSPEYGSVNITLPSSDTAVGTMSTPTFPVASSSAPITFTSGNKVGTTTLSITQPPSFANIGPSATVTATVNPAPISATGDFQTGVHVETAQTFNLPGAPSSGPAVVTVAINSGAALISKDPTAIGSASLQYSLSDTSVQTFYLQGESLASGQISFSASGYATTTVSFTTHNGSLVLCCTHDYRAAPENTYAPIALTITPVWVEDSDSGGVPAMLAPDVGSLVLTTSGNMEGQTRPVTMNPGQSTVTTYFDAVTNPSGETDLAVVLPSGFSQQPHFQTFVQLIWTTDPGVQSGGIPKPH